MPTALFLGLHAFTGHKLTLNYFVLFAWGACILCAFLGYGRAFLNLCRVRNAPWSLAGIVGISLVAVAGGVLNLFGDIVSSALITVVVVGDLLLLWYGWRGVVRLGPALEKYRQDLSQGYRKTALGLLALVLLAIPILRNVSTNPNLFGYDDWSGYVTLPAETSQLGTLPPDPFNERRITTSLGAPYFLQSFMLVCGDLRTLPFIDTAVGFILYAGILFAVFRLFELPASTCFAALLLIVVVPLVRSNLTMVVLPAAMFGALFFIEAAPSLGEGINWQRSVLLGLVAASVTCLKSNYLVPAVLICGFFYLAMFVSQKRIRVLGHAGLFAGVMFLGLLPWMWDMKLKEATYLFPIFGRGYDASAYGLPLPSGSHTVPISDSFWIWLWVLPYAGPVFVAGWAVLMAYRAKAEQNFLTVASFFLAVAFAIVTVAASTGGDSMARYVVPFQIPALLLFVAFLLRIRGKWKGRRVWLQAAVASCVLGLLFNALYFGVRTGEYLRYAQEAGLARPVDPFLYHVSVEDENRRLAALQKAIPPEQAMLARLFVSYGFDWKRNPIYIADWIGMAGLPPGMPVGKGSEALRTYLLEHSIRYVAYDYKRTRLPDPFPGVGLEALLRNPAGFGRHSWVTLQAKVSEYEQQSITTLAHTYDHVYDDGQVYVLDLQRLQARAHSARDSVTP
jgi:ACR3 family arsenite efflux pump ArsB